MTWKIVVTAPNRHIWGRFFVVFLALNRWTVDQQSAYDGFLKLNYVAEGIHRPAGRAHRPLLQAPAGISAGDGTEKSSPKCCSS